MAKNNLTVGQMGSGREQARTEKNGLSHFLSEGPLVYEAERVNKVWKTLMIEIGWMSKYYLLRKLIKSDKSYVGEEVLEVMVCAMMKSPFKIFAGDHEVSFWKGKVRDIGFVKEPTTQELFNGERLARFGLEFCQPEDALYIRLADRDQKKGTWYWVGHESITNYILRVGRSDSEREWEISADIALPASPWDLDYEFVFRLRSK